MDYRNLLKRYMAVVGAAEGVHFIPWQPGPAAWGGGGVPGVVFTQEELDELNRIAEEPLEAPG